jgi:L-amino acid N-acyltransferase YncA
MIRPASKKDIPSIVSIYNHYVEHSIITFDKDPLSLLDMESKMLAIMNNYPCLVLEEKNIIIGYAYGSQWREKGAYKSTVESTIYLDPNSKGQGFGLKLYSTLLRELKQLKFHAVIGVLSIPSEGTVPFHEKLGFEKAGAFKEVGYKFNKWVDVEFWQLIL